VFNGVLIVNDELEMLWKEVVMTYFKAVFFQKFTR